VEDVMNGEGSPQEALHVALESALAPALERVRRDVEESYAALVAAQDSPSLRAELRDALTAIQQAHNVVRLAPAPETLLRQLPCRILRAGAWMDVLFEAVGDALDGALRTSEGRDALRSLLDGLDAWEAQVVERMAQGVHNHNHRCEVKNAVEGAIQQALQQASPTVEPRG
jgi:hypothetical protein